MSTAAWIASMPSSTWVISRSSGPRTAATMQNSDAPVAAVCSRRLDQLGDVEPDRAHRRRELAGLASRSGSPRGSRRSSATRCPRPRPPGRTSASAPRGRARAAPGIASSGSRSTSTSCCSSTGRRPPSSTLSRARSRIVGHAQSSISASPWPRSTAGRCRTPRRPVARARSVDIARDGRPRRQRPARLRPRAPLASLHLDDRPAADPAGDRRATGVRLAARRRHASWSTRCRRGGARSTATGTRRSTRAVRDQLDVDGARDVRRPDARAGGRRWRERLVEIDARAARARVLRRLRLGQRRGRPQDGACSTSAALGRPERTRMLALRGGYHGDTVRGDERLRPRRRDAHDVRRRAAAAGVRRRDRRPARRRRRRPGRRGSERWPPSTPTSSPAIICRAGAPGRRRHARLRPRVPARAARARRRARPAARSSTRSPPASAAPATLFAADARRASPPTSCASARR